MEEAQCKCGHKMFWIGDNDWASIFWCPNCGNARQNRINGDVDWFVVGDKYYTDMVEK